MKRIVTALIALVCAALVVSAVHAETNLPDRGVAPELTNTTWLNTEKPLRLADLNGKVVLLHFWTFGCYNCKNTLPFIKDMYAKYHEKGLIIIGVHFPEFSYERDVKNVQAFVTKNELLYPIAIDNEGASWNAYEMHAWPAWELVDATGHRRFRTIGEGNYEGTEAAIQSLLADAAAARPLIPWLN